MTQKGLVDPNNCNMNDFDFGPKKHTAIGINHEFLYNEENFYVQTPVCEVLDINHEKNTLKIQFTRDYNHNHFQFFCGLNDLFFKYIRRNYKETDFIYSVSCGPFIVFNTKICKDKTLYFNDKKEMIISKDIKEGDLVLCLLKTKGLWVDSKTSSMKWNTFQVLKIN